MQSPVRTATNKKRFVQRFFGVSAIYFGAICVMMSLETTLLFPAPPTAYGNWLAEEFGAKDVLVPNGSDKVHTWVLKTTNAKTTLIFCHGNGESLGTLGWELAMLRDKWQANIVAFDYRGYGKTGGSPNESNILSDARCIGRWVQGHEDFRNQKLVVYGRSLGGAAAVEIANAIQTDGLILDRTFSSIVDVAASRYFFFPVRWVMRNQFKTIDKIATYHGHLLQWHGDRDELVPIRFGKKLFDACPSTQKEFIQVPGLHHNDEWPTSIWQAGKKLLDAMVTP
ncbi:MAG: alpha/beta hydrolase [Pirellula sp.]